jgi:hypothetical protein
MDEGPRGVFQSGSAPEGFANPAVLLKTRSLAQSPRRIDLLIGLRNSLISRPTVALSSAMSASPDVSRILVPRCLSGWGQHCENIFGELEGAEIEFQEGPMCETPRDNR